MRDIADKAGVSTASLYRYFPTRAELLNEALSLKSLSSSDISVSNEKKNNIRE